MPVQELPTRIIKRYPNRKLYDTTAKRYVTLEGLADLIRQGVDVQVLDHESGEDLTNLTLSQVILELEKQRGGFLPHHLLSGIIRAGGGTLEALRHSIYTSLGLMRWVDDEIAHRLEVLLEQGEISPDEAFRLRAELLHDGILPEVDAAPGLTVDRWGLPSRADITRLNTQLEELAKKIDDLTREEDD